jgi:predicted nucleotide-binding protein (sugar kinase/HSP70/actin superfamily)
MQTVIETKKKGNDWHYLCRECHHMHQVDERAVPIGCRFVPDGKCYCAEYVPDDNLEYLEWKQYKEEHKNDWLDNFVYD